MKIQIFVRLKPGVLDVQGKAVEHGLHNLGFEQAADVRVGKLIEFSVDGDRAAAERKTKEVCQKLLVNPVIEDFEMRVVE